PHARPGDRPAAGGARPAAGAGTRAATPAAAVSGDPRQGRADRPRRADHAAARERATRRAPARLHAFERRLDAGTRLELTVSQPQTIVKWTQLVIRRDRPPQRRDG